MSSSLSKKEILAVVAISLATCAALIVHDESKPKNMLEFVQAERLGTLAYPVEDGRPLAVNTFVFDGDASDAVRHAKTFMTAVRASGFPLGTAEALRFVGKAKLIDRFGHESVEPVFQYEFSMADVEKANFENLDVEGLMRLAATSKVLNSNLKSGVWTLCNDTPQGYALDFCQDAYRSM